MTSGALTGVVTDPSHAVVPHAAVELRDNAKGTIQNAKTNAQVQDLRQRERTAGDAVLQHLSVQKLHGDEGPAVFVPDVVDGADVRMI